MLECQICHKKLNRLIGKHLKSHNLSSAEYKAKFPGFETSISKPISDETRAKMRASRLGYKHDETTKAKIGKK